MKQTGKLENRIALVERNLQVREKEERKNNLIIMGVKKEKLEIRSGKRLERDRNGEC